MGGIMPEMDKNQELDRREFRRKRRARNQLIAYLVSLVVVIGCGLGLFLGTKQVLASMEEKRLAEEAQVAAEVAANEEEEMTEPVEEVIEEPVVDPLDELVDSNIATMTLEEKVAGLFFVTPESITGVGKVVKAGDGTKTALETYPVGGLIYFGQNIVSDAQLKEMISNTIMYSKFPLFIGTDEEGGEVSRIAKSGIDVTEVLTAADIGDGGDPQQASSAATTIADYMKEYGFNVNFAPVADVATNPSNEMIGDRSYGADATLVASMVKSAVTSYQENGISACAKHWPGIGDIAEDLHESAGTTSKSLEEMRQMEFQPFIAAIEAGTDMIMASHVSTPEITGDETPTSLSSLLITDILRGELGYQGIVITDAMNMSSITETYSDAEASVKAIQAGVDMILMPADFKAAYEGVLAAVAEGTITEERINESLHRIYRIKYSDSLNATTEATDTTDITDTADTTDTQDVVSE